MVSAKGALNYKRAQNNESVKGPILPIENTGFLEIEECMSEFLSVEAGRGKLLKYIQKAVNLTGQLSKDNISISLAALDIGLKDIEKKVNNIRNELIKVKNDGYKAIEELHVSLINSENELIKNIKDEIKKISDAAVNAVENYNGELDEKELAKHIEEAVAPMQTFTRNAV